jgi:DNA-directed RNA polymerase subunit RPC12/RpoP
MTLHQRKNLSFACLAAAFLSACLVVPKLEAYFGDRLPENSLLALPVLIAMPGFLATATYRCVNCRRLFYGFWMHPRNLVRTACDNCGYDQDRPATPIKS